MDSFLKTTAVEGLLEFKVPQLHSDLEVDWGIEIVRPRHRVGVLTLEKINMAHQ